MTDKITPTPRRLRVTLDIDVTEGPRLRRGTRNDDLRKWVKPLVREARDLTADLGLEAGSVNYRVEWGYTWFDVEGNQVWEREEPDTE